jgi:hypothetical protein
MRSSDATMSHQNRLSFIIVLAGVVAIAAGCAAPGSSGSDEPPGSDAALPSVPTGEVPAAMLEQVVADAASGAGVDPSAVKVISAEAVTWSDGALGCPLPDQMYTQALVPGYRVVLDVDGEEMSFHAAEGGEFSYCADPQPSAEDGSVDR